MKTQTSALVAIPPETAWEPIQRLRRQFDRKIDRWMPHVTLLYPFRPRSEFDAAGDRLTEILAARSPFEVTLAEVRHFSHGPERFTMWLAPDPGEPFVELQAAIQAAFPDCDDVSTFSRGFAPHLSVGQARGRSQLRERLDAIRSDWSPLRYTVSEVALIWREGETPFGTDRTVALGGGVTSSGR